MCTPQSIDCTNNNNSDNDDDNQSYNATNAVETTIAELSALPSQPAPLLPRVGMFQDRSGCHMSALLAVFCAAEVRSPGICIIKDKDEDDAGIGTRMLSAVVAAMKKGASFRVISKLTRKAINQHIIHNNNPPRDTNGTIQDGCGIYGKTGTLCKNLNQGFFKADYMTDNDNAKWMLHETHTYTCSTHNSSKRVKHKWLMPWMPYFNLNTSPLLCAATNPGFVLAQHFAGSPNPHFVRSARCNTGANRPACTGPFSLNVQCQGQIPQLIFIKVEMPLYATVEDTPHTISGHTYTLVGLIYDPPGHFTAQVKIGMLWYIADDLNGDHINSCDGRSYTKASNNTGALDTQIPNLLLMAYMRSPQTIQPPTLTHTLTHTQTHAPGKWKWISCSRLILTHIFTLTGPYKQIATKNKNYLTTDEKDSHVLLCSKTMEAGEKHRISLLINQCTDSLWCGVASRGIACDRSHFGSGKVWYMNCLDGSLGGQQDGRVVNSNAGKIKSGQTLTIVLNQTNRKASSLLFYVNGKLHDMGYNSGVRGQLRWAICIRARGDNVQIIPTPELE